MHPETPEHGISLQELFAGRNVDHDAMRTRMEGLMADEGLPYGTRTHTYNSRLAQEFGKWAETQATGEAIHDALFRAYFVDAKNIGSVDTLVELATSVGLPADEAQHVLANRTFQTAIDADWQRSRQLGITGVPTFVANGYGVVGAQPYEVLEQLVVTGGGKPRDTDA